MKKILLLFLFPIAAFGHGEAESTSVGPGKGVESFVEGEGYVLSKEAIKRLGIETSTITTKKTCNLKTIPIISVLNKKFIYIQRNSRFKPVPAQCTEIKSGDQIVIKGADFLRVIDMDLGADEEEEDEHGDEHGEEHGDEHPKEPGTHSTEAPKNSVTKGESHD